MAKQTLHCSFCGKPRQEVQILIAGQEAHICESCVEHALEIVDQELEDNPKDNKFNSNTKISIKKPIDIKAFLDEYVIGQDESKKVMAVAVYNHYKRVQQKVKDNEIEIDKSNIVMIGQTGTGKTLLAKTVAKLLNVPFAIVDATVFTEAGYVGEDVESIISRLLQICNYDIPSAERGIVFIDEIDKISRKGDNPSLTRDIKEGTQQALLKLLEGSEVLVPPQGGRKHPEQKMVKVNTKNILFICGGAFDGIERVISKRINTNSIGFNVDKDKQDNIKNNLLQYVNAQDLRGFGLIPELLGRLPVVTYLNPLDEVALKAILTEPKNALIKQYHKIFELEGIVLNMEEPVLDFIVEKALEYKLGARGLRSITESILTDAMFELPSSNVKEFTVTLEYALQKFNASKSHILKVA